MFRWAASGALVAALLLVGCGPGPEQAELRLGQQVWDRTCRVCHLNGLAGAPAKGNRVAWAPRIDQGLAVLVEHALQGFSGAQGSMPARGGNPQLSDEQVAAAVKYMVSQSQ
ncbi:c-type cytochrome [Pseudomonas zhanjiangensis]|uniref:Cytochrome c5 family protein n=1 Tax=Pseudomonas zhanjiangensis TaxID=3239015 RepID=A0ABV3YQR9_9PSED